MDGGQLSVKKFFSDPKKGKIWTENGKKFQEKGISVARIKKTKKDVCPIKSARSKKSRRRGHNFEREVANLLKVVFPDARRHLEYQGAEANGIDIVNTGLYKIQCKRGKKYASFTAIKEVEADEMFGDIPVLVTQGDKERILVALPFEEFLRLVQLAQ